MVAQPQPADTGHPLRARLRAAYAHHGEPSRIRLHRAISWLARAELEHDDPDARFLFLWIAFNAAYGGEFAFEQDQRRQFDLFFQRMEALDTDGRIHTLLFDTFTGPIRTLIANRYVFAPFWTALREHDSSEQWKVRLKAAKTRALHAVTGRETAVLLNIVFDRLYVLRNQLVHGGATHASSVNRAQISDGVALLAAFVPLFVERMIDHPALDFGTIAWPVFRD